MINKVNSEIPPLEDDVAEPDSVSLKKIIYPELFVGIVAPIGIDTKQIVGLISSSLRNVGYSSTNIKLTELMKSIPTDVKLVETPPEIRFEAYIDYANEVRHLFDSKDDEIEGDAALAMLAVAGIQAARKQVSVERGKIENTPSSFVGLGKEPDRQAYILDQFKRPEEVKLIRSIYGRLFILFSIHASTSTRRKTLRRKIRAAHGDRSKVDFSETAEALISTDHHQESMPHGQRVRDSFPLADVIIDANNNVSAKKEIDRAIKLFFGNNFITPTRDEYGMYLAKAAALRSADLSRQVGAAILSQAGEIITLGANEVPKPGGGTYFEGDTPDHRDYAEGVDYNEEEKRAIALEVVERLREKKLLTLPESNSRPDTLEDDFEYLMNNEEGPKLKKARVMDILEFGRQIHAEMSALVDAARLGRSVLGGTLFCTTFPCHMCTKLILSSGIKRVVYIEPFPKSYAEDMYSHSISLEHKAGNDEPTVLFQPFTGIAPFRYRDLFEKGRRKDKRGMAKEWSDDEPRPHLNIKYPNYRMFEVRVIEVLAQRKNLADRKLRLSKGSA